MKVIFNESKGYQKESDMDAERLVQTGKYRYASKEEWKKNVRDVVVKEEVTPEQEEKKNRKLENRKKLQAKQR